MFEIVVFCVIVFAVVYWAVLFIMGRRDDVLHGEFVQVEPPPPAISGPQPRFPNQPPANTEALQSLLVSLKQELKNAAKI